MHMLKPTQRTTQVAKRTRGFTIVELLIVIVVIAILAAISIVAYVGIQQRARDAAIQSDLRNFAQLADMYFVKNNKYPNASTPALTELGFQASTKSYPAQWSLSYCVSSSNDNKAYVLAAGLGQTQNVFYVSSKSSSPKKIAATSCYSADPQSVADDAGLTGIDSGIGGRNTDGSWRAWAQ